MPLPKNKKYTLLKKKIKILELHIDTLYHLVLKLTAKTSRLENDMFNLTGEHNEQ